MTKSASARAASAWRQPETIIEAIVKAIMKLHGGTAEASSTPTGETRFTLAFPELPAPRAASISDGPTG